MRRLLEWFRAWRRGERRVARPGVRGRVYERKQGAGDAMLTKTTLKPTLTPTRVYRAAEGAWYRRDPATGELTKE
jgi:hypothetical protein